MPIAAEYPLMEVIWTVIVVFAWVAWILILVRVVADVFRRRDTSGVKKAAWILLVVLFPFAGILAYLIVNGTEMSDRDLDQARTSRAEFDEYVRTVAGGNGGATEIEAARRLRDDGTITEAEFTALKQKALA